MAAESFAAVAKRRLYGLLLIVVIAGLVTLSIAIYNKAFSTFVPVRMKFDHTGNALAKGYDVTERGVIVGSVASVSSTGSGGATVTVNLDPGKIDEIPADVTAQILPKTLFGEQYVSLNIPAHPSSTHIESGAVIGQDTSPGALETEKVLGDLLPLLNALEPAQLNETLTALAQALHNRGNTLGEMLVNLDSYLKQMTAQIPGTAKSYTQQLADDLGKLGQVSLEYNGVTPDLFATLQNLQTSVHTIITHQAGLNSLLVSGTDASNVLNGFLADNEQRLIQVTGQTTKIYGLLDEYSPEFTCLLAGLNDLADRANSAIYDDQIHLNVTVDTDLANGGFQTQPYTPGQEPRTVTGYGPHCFGLPDNPQPTVNGKFQIPSEFQLLCDGAPLTYQGESVHYPTSPGAKPPAGGTRCKQPNASPASASSAMNSPEENAMVNALVAGQLHTTPNKVPGVATLLVAPLLRGQQVVVK
jgi:virulence factor Mce family protein